MKRIKIFLTAFVVLATVGSALAVKANFFGCGSIYCASTCSVASRVDFMISPTGGATKPCGIGTAGNEKPSWMYNSAGNCTLNNLGLKYNATATGK